MEKVGAMRFVYMFLDFVENHGIFDEFDAEENRMVTSQGVKNLIEIAKHIVPERLANDEAAEAMRDLTEDERDFLIGEDEEGIVLDMRDAFAEKMAENGGARGLIRQIADAQRRGDANEVIRLIQLGEEFSEKISPTS